MTQEPQIKPDDLLKVVSSDVAADLRLSDRMPRNYVKFHTAEQSVAVMLEIGLIDQELHDKINGARFGYKQHLPAEDAPNFIEMVSQAKNPTALLTMVSQTVGAKYVGNDIVGIKREDVSGDPRDIMQLIQEPLVRSRASFESIMRLVNSAAESKAKEGTVEPEDVAKLRKVSKALFEVLRELKIPL